MNITFTIKNITENSLANIAAMPAQDAYNKLSSWALGDLKHCVKRRIGCGAFRDAVEFNGMMKRGCQLSFKIEPRRGYKLATFTASR